MTRIEIIVGDEADMAVGWHDPATFLRAAFADPNTNAAACRMWPDDLEQEVEECRHLVKHRWVIQTTDADGDDFWRYVDEGTPGAFEATIVEWT